MGLFNYSADAWTTLYVLFGNIFGYNHDLVGLIRALMILATIMMLLNCFFGYKILKFMITLGGIILGAFIGVLVGLRMDSEAAVILMLFIFAVIFGILAFKLYKLGIFLHFWLIGTLAFSVIFAFSGKSNSFWICVVLGLIIGILALVLHKPFIIVTTAITGGFSAGSCIATLMAPDSSDNLLGIILSIVLAILGMAVQFNMNKKEEKGEATAAEQDAGCVSAGSEDGVADITQPQPAYADEVVVTPTEPPSQPQTDAFAASVSPDMTRSAAEPKQPKPAADNPAVVAFHRYLAEFKQLETMQKLYLILAAVAAFCFLVTFRFTNFGLDFLTLAGSGLLLWTLLRKKEFPNLLFAVALSVFALRFLAVDVQRIFGAMRYRITFFLIVSRLALYLLLAYLWVFSLRRDLVTKTLNRAAMGGFAFLLLYHFISLFRSYGLRGFLFSLGEIAFYAVFAILLFAQDQKLPDNASGDGISDALHRRTPDAPNIVHSALSPATHTQPMLPAFSEFVAQPVLEWNTSSVQSVQLILSSKAQSWPTQEMDSLLRWACRGGNGYFASLAGTVQGLELEYLTSQQQRLEHICRAVAEFASRGYNAYYPEGQAAYKGWIIERLFRQEGMGEEAKALLFDYCLGADGNLYMIVTKRGSTEKPMVLNVIFYSPIFIQDPFCNVYSAVISGVAGALDAIPLNRNDPCRRTHLRSDNDYYYDFPIQINDKNAYPFHYLNGITTRICALLDERGKAACCSKYDWMRQYLYAEASATGPQAKTENEIEP